MKIVKKKYIKDLNRIFYNVKQIICDDCHKEIKVGEMYLEVHYCKERYDEKLLYKHFCKDCIKDNMYKMFIENDYTTFSKYICHEDTEWFDLDEWDLESFGCKILNDVKKVDD